VPRLSYSMMHLWSLKDYVFLQRDNNELAFVSYFLMSMTSSLGQHFFSSIPFSFLYLYMRSWSTLDYLELLLFHTIAFSFFPFPRSSLLVSKHLTFFYGMDLVYLRFLLSFIFLFGPRFPSFGFLFLGCKRLSFFPWSGTT
jgi:hypothetical protein